MLVWGRCDYGQLGLPGYCQNEKHRCCWRPHEIPHLKGAQQVCTGYCSLSVCNKESYKPSHVKIQWMLGVGSMEHTIAVKIF